ncbi:hypothetical protein MMC24_007100 [Lignoscripta atroalba]|nr:hypothetical protein [Lignoscripta atroalba]
MAKMTMDDLDNSERTKQLEMIDQLRELGVGEDISLPQLVVVGDQSSGKSSLLEGLTGLPFPVASQLCTRFATQVSFRRSATDEEKTTVSIIPAADADDTYKQKVAAYTRNLDEFSASTFGEVLNEAATYMGLPTTAEDALIANKRFSSDVLKIEIIGPKQHHLSVVDVPGLYHNPTKEQTLQDLATIRNLIEGYVQDRRTIIMAVLDSRNNLANQEVFRIAKAADYDGTRTIGIMTKLDALQPGDEPAAIKIAQNKAEKLKHGWYCVRNRSTQEVMEGVTTEQRHENERAFFKTSPWNELDNKRTGITNLKLNLGKLLSQHIGREFPEIRKEIDVHYLRCRNELTQLGSPRQNSQEQLQYLIKLATTYQRHVEDALGGRYTDAGTHPSKLRMHVQNAGDRFNEEMHARGYTMAFKSSEDELEVGSKVQKIDEYEFASNSDLEDEEEKKKLDIYDEIKKLWRTSRGRELPGHVNPSVLEVLFQHQTTNWENIAENHIAHVIELIEDCNAGLFDAVCLDQYVKDKLRSLIETSTKEAIDAAGEELSIVLKDERSGPLLTNNHYYADNLNAARADRFVNGLKKLGFVDGADQRIDFKRMKSSVHLSNETSAIYDIHDSLKAYYKVALKRFIDNVAIQVIERNLLGEKGPVSIFTPEFVTSLTPEELAYIAGEDYATSNRRLELNAQIARLNSARKICSGKMGVS